MHHQHRNLRFCLVLPLAQLLFCFAVLWPIRNIIVFEVRLSMGKPQLTGPYLNSVWFSPFLITSIPWEQFLSPEAQQQMLWIPALLDAPAMLVEIPYAILSSKHSAWSPRGFDFRLWRALTCPFGGLVFWWIAGRGIDALIAARRRLITPSITWAETGVGVFSLASGVLFCGVSVVSRLEDDHLTTSW